ncbi:hypothetical protein MKK63_23615 [Methylobacterium sp. J-088]|uniref:hypothetical protein n=1 Tax=unclassified Methylobacterium TaxID=2615210 RepID=UPI001FB89A7C|nr:MULTISPECIES: hypothetical protein [unclassified Methylobacterium]MCJ2065675.1 hypothetical protein [Methylobacterium sp. J-088]
MARSASLADWAILPRPWVIAPTPCEAVCKFADISRVTADCSSTVVEIAPATSFSRTIVAWIAPTASRVASCVPEICDPICSVARDV